MLGRVAQRLHHLQRLHPGSESKPGIASSLRTSRSAYQLLRVAFVLVPVVTGFDKLSGMLVDWPRFVSPKLAALLPFSVESALYAVGLLEIFLGMLVLILPRTGAFVLAGWFGASALNFALLGDFWHIAFRDAGLTLAALALARFSSCPEFAITGWFGAREPRSSQRLRHRSPRSDTLMSAPDE